MAEDVEPNKIELMDGDVLEYDFVLSESEKSHWVVGFDMNLETDGERIDKTNIEKVDYIPRESIKRILPYYETHALSLGVGNDSVAWFGKYRFDEGLAAGEIYRFVRCWRET